MDSAKNNLKAFRQKCKIVTSDGEEEVSEEYFTAEIDKLEEFMATQINDDVDLDLDMSDEELFDECLSDEEDIEAWADRLSIAFKPKNEKMACVSHTLQNSVNNSIEKNDELSDFVAYLEKCFSFFNNRLYFLNEIRKKHKKSLLKTVITRWNSRQRACIRLNDVILDFRFLTLII
jgi:hypothetical protein